MAMRITASFLSVGGLIKNEKAPSICRPVARLNGQQLLAFMIRKLFGIPAANANKRLYRLFVQWAGGYYVFSHYVKNNGFACIRKIFGYSGAAYSV